MSRGIGEALRIRRAMGYHRRCISVWLTVSPKTCSKYSLGGSRSTPVKTIDPPPTAAPRQTRRCS